MSLRWFGHMQRRDGEYDMIMMLRMRPPSRRGRAKIRFIDSKRGQRCKGQGKKKIYRN